LNFAVVRCSLYFRAACSDDFFFISYIRTYITPERTRKVLGNKKGLRYYFLASIIGTVTPFCSCSSVPIFIGFVDAGVPLGVTFSFLITSPLVNEAAVAALWAILGLKATIIYVVSGVVLGVRGGYLIGLLKLERYVEDFVYKIKGRTADRKTRGTDGKGKSRYCL
jgi:uncharacterized membrane protein YraQ (UPF0718 family)